MFFAIYLEVDALLRRNWGTLLLWYLEPWDVFISHREFHGFWHNEQVTGSPLTLHTSSSSCSELGYVRNVDIWNIVQAFLSDFVSWLAPPSQDICFSVPIFSFDFFTSVRNIGSILFGIPYKIILWRLIKLMLEMLRSSVISPGLANKRSLFITALK